MLNNSFGLSGVAISDIKKVESDLKVEQYEFNVEVDRAKGKAFVFTCYFYQTNKFINPKWKIKGKLIAINGQLESYSSKNGVIYNRLSAQNIYFPNNNKKLEQDSNAENSYNSQIINGNGFETNEELPY